MLRELSVKNFALLRELRIEFGEGLNILTGATGAGKSILVGAVGLLLGVRAGTHMIRQGASSATVEGVFNISSRKNLLDNLNQMGLAPEQGLLILKRQVSMKGDSRAYANGSRLTMAQLKKVGDLLVDFHGQHDHQSLLHSAQHRTLLDEYGDLNSLKRQVQADHQSLTVLRQELQNLRQAIQERRERQELFKFQLNDIEGVNPQEDEDQNLAGEKNVLENVEQLFQGVSSAYQSLFEEDNSIISRLSVIRQTLENLSKIDDVFEEKGRQCATLIYQLDDLSTGLRQYAQRLRRDPDRLSEIEDRIQQLQRLKKKYGGSLSTVLRSQKEISLELRSLAMGDERLEQLAEKVSGAQRKFSQECERLSSARERVALKLQGLVEKELSRLGMQKARFAVQIERIEDEHGWAQLSGLRFRADSCGMDQIEFLLSANPGEGLRPLAKVASGGEISRIMLAMKRILAQADQVPLLIFDEIDVGIGGRVAGAVGRALKTLAESHQVLCITHLHQIACLGDDHFLVYKEQSKGRTETIVKKLSSKDREKENARMMGGEKITGITLAHAREIVQNRDKPEESIR